MADLGVAVIQPTSPRKVADSYQPLAVGMPLGSALIQTIRGYVYQPPTQGQLWPRGDYVPYG